MIAWSGSGSALKTILLRHPAQHCNCVHQMRAHLPAETVNSDIKKGAGSAEIDNMANISPSQQSVFLRNPLSCLLCSQCPTLPSFLEIPASVLRDYLRESGGERRHKSM